ncbi:endonuclease/exonuclease/phosphatase family protein [Sungkyunkwania multivorans]|uniref:Endonuclease/exonuclease/phosphatase family protein n=1 Tax=Sungkyunkwania multivorans TaxID=1173618 RepID=A0ABW3CW12_9FLAO
MKNLSFLDKIIFLINSLFAALLLLSYGLPYVFPNAFPVLAVLSLTVPVLILVNLFFVVYWVIRLKRQLLLSALVLLLGFGHLNSLYRFSNKSFKKNREDFSVMSYNVRLFNLYEWINDKRTEDNIVSFIEKKNPDALCLQEFHLRKEDAFSSMYPYRYIKLKSQNNKAGLAIFSKFRIVNSGSLDFPDTYNNGIYADIVKGTDTIRVYNLHLESLRIDPYKEELTQENSGRLLKRMSRSFVKQQFQSDIFALHQKGHRFQRVVCGDFNNTQYSHVYKEIKGDMMDAFDEAGSGFGRTFKFKFFPLRIDFIFVEKHMKVKGFETFKEEYSDHYPVMATLKI